MKVDKLREFEPIFYPKSIAVVGAFSSRFKGGYNFLANLVTAGFRGAVYPVSTSDNEVLGMKIYRSVTDIPAPVDYVMVCVPAHSVLPVLDDCATKGVKVVQMFTAGFSETGKREGRLLEEEIVQKAKVGKFHIIGPNCIGVYSPSVNMPCGPESYLGEKGDVALLSQSGGHAGRIIKAGISRRLGFSKGVSFGNGADLDSVDYLEYFAVDPETKIIGAYIEGVRDGRRFYNLLREITATKPVVLLKGGKTTAGAVAAASHTGSLAASHTIWSAALKQTGAIQVESVDELVDTLIALDRLPSCGRGNVALVSGLAAGGGGDSVTSSDACFEWGLAIPPFSGETKKRLQSLVTWPGTFTPNPLDLSGLGGKLENLEAALQAIGVDPAIDFVIVQAHADDISHIWTTKGLEAITEALISFAEAQMKPLIVVLPPGLAENERLKAETKLCQTGVAVYPSIERAAKAIALTCRFHSNQCSR